jgi:hypothetical protein
MTTHLTNWIADHGLLAVFVQGTHAGLGLAIVAAFARARGSTLQSLKPSTVGVRRLALEPSALSNGGAHVH